MNASLKKPLPEISVDIHGQSHDGRGIATINGKTTFVHGALPNEKVLCKITKQHRRYSEGKTIAVTTPAPERTTPACSHFGICGGCSLQHMEATKQIKFKQDMMLEQLKHFGNVTPEHILPPLTGNTLGYRRKARLGVRYVQKKGKLLVGFRENISNYLTDVESCPVLHPSVGTRITLLSELIRSLSQYEQIPQIEIAVGDEATALVFRHLTPLPADDMLKLSEFGKTYGLHIYLQPTGEKIHKIWPQDNQEKLSYHLEKYQIEIQFHPLDFIQVNNEINQQMLAQAIDLLEIDSTDRILDLFCGLGNFTLPLSRFAHLVVGIEGSQQMVERAEENAKHNKINNVKFYAANLMQPTSIAEWMQPYDKILLDPPRTGAKEIIPLFSPFSPKKIMYISCNPATLARDAGELVNTLGYRLTKVGVINMFPHTSHVETMALFER